MPCASSRSIANRTIPLESHVEQLFRRVKRKNVPTFSGMVLTNSRGVLVRVPTDQSTVLTSWKAVAGYLGKGVRTAQRWEQLGLPVRRPPGAVNKSSIVVYSSELDAWRATHFLLNRPKKVVRATDPCRTERSSRWESIRNARELLKASNALTKQITSSASLLAQRCDSLATLTLEVSWRITGFTVPQSSESSASSAKAKEGICSADKIQKKHWERKQKELDELLKDRANLEKEVPSSAPKELLEARLIGLNRKILAARTVIRAFGMPRGN